MTKETRTVTINEQSYHIIGESTKRKNIATVYDDDHPGRREDAVMAKKKERKEKWLGLVSNNVQDLPNLMQDALTEAVQEVEQERLQSEQIDEMVDNVKETYEE